MSTIALGLSLSSNQSQDQSSAIAGVVPGTAGTVRTSMEREKVVDRHQSRAEISGYDPPPPVRYPGKISEGGCGDSRVPLVERTNSWTAGGFRGELYRDATVCAGAYVKNPETGLFFIVSSRIPGPTTFNAAMVPRSGPVHITGAPLGAKGSARVWDAHIKFKGSLGTYGYLDLADNSIHVTGGPVEGECPSGTTGEPPNCVIDKAELGALRVTPRNKISRPGMPVVFTARIENIGRAPAKNVRTCVAASRKLVRATKWCLRVEKLPVGEAASLKFPMTVKKNAEHGQEIPLRFKATAGAGTKNAETAIKVR